MSGYWLSGVRMKGVALAHGVDRARQAADQDQRSTRRPSRYSLLPPLVGSSDIELRRRTPSAARRAARTTSHGKDRSVDVTLDAIDLGQVEPLVAAARRAARTASSAGPCSSRSPRARRPRAAGSVLARGQGRRGRRRQGEAQGRARAAARSTSARSRSPAEAKDGVAQDHASSPRGGKDVELQGDGRITHARPRDRLALRRRRCASRSTTPTGTRTTSRRASSARPARARRRSSSSRTRRSSSRSAPTASTGGSFRGPPRPPRLRAPRAAAAGAARLPFGLAESRALTTVSAARRREAGSLQGRWIRAGVPARGGDSSRTSRLTSAGTRGAARRAASREAAPREGAGPDWASAAAKAARHPRGEWRRRSRRILRPARLGA